MNNILVIATAARAGGALSILKKTISDAKKTTEKYTFLVDPSIKNTLDKSDNIEYIGINTKNWIKRIYFDIFGYSKIIKNSTYNICLNLQNVPVRIKNIKQYVYYHQSLPLIRYNFFKKDKKLWLYQKFYLFFVKINISYAYKFIVQTQWIYKNLYTKINFPSEKVEIIEPVININKDLINTKLYDPNKNILFYPAAPYFYKNHIVIIHALLKIPESYLRENNYLLILTITENEYVEIYKENIPSSLKEFIKFLGKINNQEVHHYLNISKALLFPSYIETFGLPLIEAMNHGCFIIASDLEYSYDTLKKYNNKSLCSNDNIEMWANEIKSLIEKNKIQYIDNSINLNKDIINFIINDNKD
ncbi:glycosyltransferase [Proteus sp. G2639]|uniref:Gt3 n=1 Tax=Proteus vulgaris TaxID=585 RepID=A0A385JN47_PROVU|nr:glycosyltransferase [Proteus sp. G2300]AXY99757.1 gt3 [Proteus vulgaris]NBN58826.1 glycosyltransferase [Proteus sp. G2639]NBN84280.1 glycosyltransferase [Proteus sp. G2300]